MTMSKNFNSILETVRRHQGSVGGLQSHSRSEWTLDPGVKDGDKFLQRATVTLVRGEKLKA